MFKITQSIYEKDPLCHILPHLENYKGRIYAKKIEIFNKEFKININSSKDKTRYIYNYDQKEQELLKTNRINQRKEKTRQ